MPNSVDFSEHYIQAKGHLTEVYEAMNVDLYDVAIERALLSLAEISLMINEINRAKKEANRGEL